MFTTGREFTVFNFFIFITKFFITVKLVINICEKGFKKNHFQIKMKQDNLFDFDNSFLAKEISYSQFLYLAS